MDNKETEKQDDQNKDLTKSAEDLIATVAHDLRAPLNISYTLTELLEKKAFGALTGPQANAIATLKENIYGAIDLADKILDVRQLDTKNIKPVVKTFDLIPFLEACKNSNQVLANKKSIAIDSFYDEDRQLKLDPIRIRQVINNIVQNCIKFSQPNTQITIKTKNHDHNFIIFITDQGPGISEEELPHIFDKYKKLSAQATGGERGLGLGMAIVKYIIELHNGKIDVKSVLDQGTTFIITLPYSIPE